MASRADPEKTLAALNAPPGVGVLAVHACFIRTTERRADAAVAAAVGRIEDHAAAVESSLYIQYAALLRGLHTSYLEHGDRAVYLGALREALLVLADLYY